MKIHELKINNKFDGPQLALCIGFFDGVHRGHQALLEEAKSHKIPVGVFMFSDDMRLKIRHESSLLTTLKQREQLMKDYGVDYLFYLPFTEQLSQMSPEQFVTTYLDLLPICRIVVGDDFRFGKGACGSADLLKELIHKPVDVVPLTDDKFEKISSSRIKKLIENGQVEEALVLLGHTYAIDGIVVEGFHNGHKINFPTANISVDKNVLLPKIGVYAGLACVDDIVHLSMINVGIHPTIMPLDMPIIEVHIIDFVGDIYHKEVRVEFLRYLRDEMKFSSLNALQQQVRNDRQNIIDTYKKR